MIAVRFHLPLVPTIAAAALFISCASPVRADMIYAVSGAGGSTQSMLYTLNYNGSVASTIGPITLNGSPVVLTGIAYYGGTLYGATNAGSSFADPNSLVTISPTGTATLVGTAGAIGTMQSVTMTSNGVMYGYSKNSSPSEALFQINLNGTTSVIGQSGLTTSGDGLAVNSSGTSIYLAPGGASGNLDTLSLSNGSVLTSTGLSGAPLSSSQIKAMSFDSTGTLYGLDFMPGSPYTTDLVTINPGTGVITNDGSTPNGLVGIAFAPAAVPEPGSFILVGLCMLVFVLYWITANRTP